MSGRRRRAASVFAEALQLALADGLELAVTLAGLMAGEIVEGRMKDEGGVAALLTLADSINKSKDEALAMAAARRATADGEG